MRQGLEYVINLQDGTFGRGMANAQKQTSGLDRAVRNLGSSLAAAFAASKLFDIGEDAVQTSAKVNNLERAIKFAGGKEGADNLAFVKNEVKRLGLDILATESGFRTLTGSMGSNAKLAKHQKALFTGLAEGITALGGSSEQFEGALLAVSQMASKGVVNAEELRGQLAERLPKALEIAARSMNMTEAELGKVMEKGELFASDFLPRFAQELHKTFGAEAAKNADSFVANMHRQNSALIETKVILGEQLQPAYLSYLELQVQAMGLLSATVGFVKDNEAGFKALAVGLGVVAVGYGLYIGVQKAALAIQAIQYTSGLLYLGYLEAQALGLGVAASAQHALNIAMNANPIGLIITGVALLSAGLYYAHQKSETFRAGLKGTFAALKELIEPAIGLGKALIGITTFNPSMISEGLSQAKEAISNMNISGAFKNAFDAEIAASAVSALAEPKGSLSGAQNPQPVAPSGARGAGASAAAGNSVRNVNVSIQNLVKELVVQATTVKESGNEIRKQLAQILIDTTRDYEQAVS